jgi:protein tyrosine/serine phosphatase
MRNFLSLRPAFVVSALVLAFIFNGRADGPRGVAASQGIANFGRVSSTFLRGAQPDEHGIEDLKRLGVATIVNLRRSDDVWPGEAAAARRNGIGYVNVPLRGLSAPTDAEVAQVLSLLEASPPPVFVHCEHGADRTGAIVACYRLSHDGWTAE